MHCLKILPEGGCYLIFIYFSPINSFCLYVGLFLGPIYIFFIYLYLLFLLCYNVGCAFSCNENPSYLFFFFQILSGASCSRGTVNVT